MSHTKKNHELQKAWVHEFIGACKPLDRPSKNCYLDRQVMSESEWVRENDFTDHAGLYSHAECPALVVGTMECAESAKIIQYTHVNIIPIALSSNHYLEWPGIGSAKKVIIIILCSLTFIMHMHIFKLSSQRTFFWWTLMITLVSFFFSTWTVLVRT